MPDWAIELLVKQFPVAAAVCVTVILAVRFTVRRMDRFLEREQQLIERFEQNVTRLSTEFSAAQDRMAAVYRERMAELNTGHRARVRSLSTRIRD